MEDGAVALVPVTCLRAKKKGEEGVERREGTMIDDREPGKNDAGCH